MVSTRSSARKPPNPSRPLSTASVATPVLDDPPPPYPRRSPRIRIKNGQHSPVQSISLTPSVANAPLIRQVRSRKPVQNDLEEPREQTTHTNDEPPEEVSAVDAKQQVDERGRVERTARIAVQTGLKKKRRRRRRKEITVGAPSSAKLIHDDTSQTYNNYSDASVGERLSPDAILAAQSAVQDARFRKEIATETALLKKQVRHLGNVKRPQRIGDVEITLTEAVTPVHNVTTNGRKSAISFLASCFQKGPQRVSASRIALAASSIKSLRA